MWLIVQERYPIWYFDATGGIIKKIKGQAKPLLYSLVFHDKDKKLILPLTEFITTANDSKSISSYLADVKMELLKKIPTRAGAFQLAPIIVTDFCWGLINSVMESFNNCTATIYINWCYEILFKKDQTIILASVIKTIFQLCAVHFLKLIINKIRKIKPLGNEDDDKKIQNFFIFAFTLLQNSTTIEEFSNNLKDIYNIFNLKYVSKYFEYSNDKIKNQLLQRNMTVISFDEKDESNKKKRKKQVQNIMIVDDDFSEDSLKNNSPFKIYYDKLIKKHAQNVKLKLLNHEKDTINFYFCPEMFNILLDYTHVLPFWTGIMLNYWKQINPKYTNVVTTRIDNNSVENWFKQVNIMFPDTPVMPSQYTSRMKTRVDSEFIGKYKFEAEGKKLNNSKHYSEAKETWRDFNTDMKKKKTIHLLR